MRTVGVWKVLEVWKVLKVRGARGSAVGARRSPGLDRYLGDPEAVEHLARVDWIRAVPEQEAFWDSGMFAVPISCCQLRQRFTLDWVSEHFELPEYQGATNG